ncbi:MAG: hypothetical protein ED555_02975 [Allomuricauda sp.]|nr:MAG: hypothetical protein ED555_02975 [Allomuricauda sp.]
MIKFFRRIRQKLLQEKRFSKYLLYAIGEIILVVIGILIALQINNWNDLRKERKKEMAYLKRIKEDLDFDKNYLKLNKEFYLDVFNAGNLVLLYNEGEPVQPVTNWHVLMSYFHSSQIWPIISTSSTYEELRSSGELSLIQNVNLRNDLSFYHGGGLKRYAETIGINPPYRKMVRGLIPNTIQNYMWDHCHMTEGDIQIIKECDGAIDEEEALNIIRELGSNAELQQELRYYMSSIKVGLTTLKEQENLCHSLLKEVEFEIVSDD